MQKLVIFDGIVAYNEDEALLYNILENDKRVSLYAPTNKCLALLVENRSEVISQNVFFTRVWECQGLSITANTFYQHIAMLRRAFEEVGLEGEVIVTIPRRGLSLSGKVNLTFENTVDIIEVVAKKHNDTSSTHDIFQKPSFKIKIILIYLLLGLFFLAFSFYLTKMFFSDKYRQRNLLSAYENVGNVEHCNIFVYSSFSTLKDVETKIKNDNIDCSSNTIIYYSSVPMLNRTSLIACAEKNNERQTCLSYFYITSR